VKRRVFAGLAVAAAAVAAWRFWPRPSLSEAELAALYAAPLTPPSGPVDVFHLGHSLVGRDMPAMLAQLGGHRHASQLGWGASLRDHWQGDVPGFAEENASAAFRPASEALDSGAYPVVVLTEMVELRDAIRWHESARHLALWAEKARAANPTVRVYLYETWHHLDDPSGWAARIKADLPDLWEAQVLRPAVAKAGAIHVIPGGQVMAALVAAAAAGDLPGLTGPADLFADTIHLTDIGAYAIALAHYAAIYGRSPQGLPHALLRADGSPATPPPAAAAPQMQAVVWRVVSGYALSGTGAG
jgi:hypothetical protein